MNPKKTSISNVNNKSTLNFQIDYFHIILQKLIKNILKIYNLIDFSQQFLKYSPAVGIHIPPSSKSVKMYLKNHNFILIFRYPFQNFLSLTLTLKRSPRTKILQTPLHRSIFSLSFQFFTFCCPVCPFLFSIKFHPILLPEVFLLVFI